MSKKRSKTWKGPVRVMWENPPGPDSGLLIERQVRGHVYSRRVGPRGFLTATEASYALGVRREYIYRLIWDGKLKSVKRKGQIAIPLSALKPIMEEREKRLGAQGDSWLIG